MGPTGYRPVSDVKCEANLKFVFVCVVLQRQAEKKADEQRRRRERKRKKIGPAEVNWQNVLS